MSLYSLQLIINFSFQTFCQLIPLSSHLRTCSAFKRGSERLSKPSLLMRIKSTGQSSRSSNGKHRDGTRASTVMSEVRESRSGGSLIASTAKVLFSANRWTIHGICGGNCDQEEDSPAPRFTNKRREAEVDKKCLV
jgi:hypothetical protein